MRIIVMVSVSNLALTNSSFAREIVTHKGHREWQMFEFFGIAFNKTDFLIPALQIRLLGYNTDAVINTFSFSA
jgi:hypothetical protein